ncbi:MAG TPA: antitoxin Xre-like helix-turn-helix domain-containing protein [Chitinophagaceae bacterium]|nr:antitoxin Xre-like helix-turn-helix domain-containing protein [Chitinophagaceae bacterium]
MSITMESSKNKKKISVEYKSNSRASKLHEPSMLLSTIKPMSLVKDFNYKEFKKISDNVPFTLQEWSDILHISERTLQRYAKANSNFPFSVTDRVLQIDKVIKRGIHVFGNMEKFIGWLRDNPFMLEGRLSLQSLATIDGIHKILTQLGRIEHGIFA